MRIEYTESALEDLSGIPKRFAEQILRKITRLESGLRGDIKRLQTSDIGYRLRSGDYRILFDLEGDRIVIQKIKHRRQAYD
jgi:mRNA interferase RelE/StbE